VLDACILAKLYLIINDAFPCQNVFLICFACVFTQCIVTSFKCNIFATSPLTSPSSPLLLSFFVKAAYDAAVARKTAYQAPPPPAPKSSQRGPRFAPVDLIPHRRPGAEIQRDMRAEADAERAARNPAGGVRGAHVSRQAQVETLQDRMEGVPAPAAAAGAVAARRAGAKPGARGAKGAAETEEERLFAAILGEIREREQYIARMRSVKGPLWQDQLVEKEIKDRVAELQKLSALIDDAAGQ